jgi:hypothetical protein
MIVLENSVTQLSINKMDIKAAVTQLQLIPQMDKQITNGTDIQSTHASCNKILMDKM